MKWAGKEISTLSDDELWAAIQSVADMDNFRFDKLLDHRIKKSNHRLNKIFKAKPPNESAVFADLVIELNKEYQNRNLQNEHKIN